jgi:hypothetical protein
VLLDTEGIDAYDQVRLSTLACQADMTMSAATELQQQQQRHGRQNN